MRQADHVFADTGDGIAAALFALVKLIGQFAERAFDSANGFLGLRAFELRFETGNVVALFAQIARQTLQALSLGIDQTLGLFEAAGDGFAAFFVAFDRGAQVLRFFDEAVGDLGLSGFGTLQTAKNGVDGGRDATYGSRRTAFRTLDAGAQRFECAGDAAQFTRSRTIFFVFIVTRTILEDRAATQLTGAQIITNRLTIGFACRFARRQRTGSRRKRRRPADRLRVGHIVLGFTIDGRAATQKRLRRGLVARLAFTIDGGADVLALENHLIEPLTQSHAGTTRQILGHFTRLGIDTLHAPRCARAHAIPLTVRPQSVDRIMLSVNHLLTAIC